MKKSFLYINSEISFIIFNYSLFLFILQEGTTGNRGIESELWIKLLRKWIHDDIMSPSVIRVIGRRVTVRLGKCIIESIPIWAYHNLILRTECALNDKAYFSYIKYMAGDGADRLAATGRRRCFFFLYNNRLFFPNKWLNDRERLYCAVLSAEKEIKMTSKVNTTTKTNTSSWKFPYSFRRAKRLCG